MNKLTALFATTTALFAASGVSRAQRLHERIPASEDLATSPAASISSRAPLPRSTAAVITPANAPAGAAVEATVSRREPTESIVDLERDARRNMADRARKILPDFDDPQKRQKMLLDAMAEVRRSNPRLAEFLGITDQAAEQLTELLANQMLRVNEESLRCSQDEGCRLMDVGRGLHDRDVQEIEALLGAEGRRRLDEFRMSIPERQSIVVLRGRFTDATRLTDAQAEKLATALAEVRQRAESDLELRNAGVSEYGSGVLGFVYPGGPEDHANADDQLAEATEYGQRLRERAAQILSKEQLAIFDEARAEVLRGLEFALREPRS